MLSALRQLDPDKINYELAVAAVEWVVGHGEEGAILIFMPGLMEIRWGAGLDRPCSGFGASSADRPCSLFVGLFPDVRPAL